MVSHNGACISCRHVELCFCHGEENETFTMAEPRFTISLVPHVKRMRIDTLFYEHEFYSTEMVILTLFITVT